MFVCLNHLSCQSLGGISPLQALTGNVPDISALVQFRFYEPVYFKDKGKHYPSSSDERAGYWVGIADNCGDALTYLILTKDTLKVVPRSAVRSGLDKPNLRLEPFGGEEDKKPIVFVKGTVEQKFL